MSYPWEREGLTSLDYVPPFEGRDDLLRRISQLWRNGYLKHSTAQNGSIGFLPYVRPAGRGRHDVKTPYCGSTVITIPGPRGAFRSGQFVSVGSNRFGATLLGEPPSGLVGASSFTLDDAPTGTVDDLDVTEVTADLVAGLANQTITLKGFGFLQTPLDEFFAEIYNESLLDWTADPYVTLHDPTWVSSTQVTVLADVAAAAPDGYRGWYIHFARAGMVS